MQHFLRDEHFIKIKWKNILHYQKMQFSFFFLNLPPARYVIINHATTSGTSLHYITYFRNKLFETYMFRVSSVIKLTRIFISEGFIPFVSNKYMHVN